MDTPKPRAPAPHAATCRHCQEALKTASAQYAKAYAALVAANGVWREDGTFTDDAHRFVQLGIQLSARLMAARLPIQPEAVLMLNMLHKQLARACGEPDPTDSLFDDVERLIALAIGAKN